MKKLILALLVAALCMVAPAAAIVWADLPVEGVEVLIDGIYPPGDMCGTYFDVTLIEEGITYPAWCVQTGIDSIKDTPYCAHLSKPVGDDWNKVNWVLNNKGNADYKQIQAAIWTITGQNLLPGYGDAVSDALVAAADPTFQCSEGYVGAVFVTPCEEDGQDLIIEIPCPDDVVVPEFPTMMIPVFLVGSVLVAASVLKKE